MTTCAQIEDRFEREQDEYTRQVALERYKSGDKSYKYSSNSFGFTTAGYGTLDEYGNFDYPLEVNQWDWNIVEGVL